jgi:CPA2 family monovalent cation:H+ antiporter-2
MFFLGLEFSLPKFKRVRTAVLLIGSVELFANLSLGFLVGYLLAWGTVERFFRSDLCSEETSSLRNESWRRPS